MTNDSSFRIKELTDNQCLCDSCGDSIARTEVRIPIAVYNSYLGNEIMGSSRYFYFCDECKQKLIDVLKDGDTDAKHD